MRPALPRPPIDDCSLGATRHFRNPLAESVARALQHRRRMRQIEAHRSNPSIPLKPPPSPFWRWLKKYSNFFLMLIPLANLYQRSHTNAPNTVNVVIDISFQVGSLLFLIGMFMFEQLLDYISEVVGGMLLFLHRITDPPPDLP
jgi:hypothetical protein